MPYMVCTFVSFNQYIFQIFVRILLSIIVSLGVILSVSLFIVLFYCSLQIVFRSFHVSWIKFLYHNSFYFVVFSKATKLYETFL